MLEPTMGRVEQVRPCISLPLLSERRAIPSAPSGIPVRAAVEAPALVSGSHALRGASPAPVDPHLFRSAPRSSIQEPRHSPARVGGRLRTSWLAVGALAARSLEEGGRADEVGGPSLVITVSRVVGWYLRHHVPHGGAAVAMV